jgi:acetyl-CoA synthetase
MADVPKVAKYPVAHRVAKAAHKPHVGPDRKAYEEAHKESVGEKSNEWWGKVCGDLFLIILF